jgi:hypothetical protein
MGNSQGHLAAVYSVAELAVREQLWLDAVGIDISASLYLGVEKMAPCIASASIS